MTAESSFHEKRFLNTPIRDLGLTIAGTPLEPVIAEFRAELERVGIRRLKPDFYLSTEWGVPFESVSIGIPFYLTRAELVDVHMRNVGHLEGVGRAELLRYLRHEMGHVVNYAYRLYRQTDWVDTFGSMTQPYLEQYCPEPFSRRFVWHLPGWYAQKHPDEDWAETFAVWMTPGSDWRATYAAWPIALAKLEFCDRIMASLQNRDPPLVNPDRDEDVSSLTASVDDYYRSGLTSEDPAPLEFDGALRSIFEEAVAATNGEYRPAAQLIMQWELELTSNVFRWTGHFPEVTRHLLRQLAERVIALRLVYPADREAAVVVALTTLVTSLAMNHVYRGSYLP